MKNIFTLPVLLPSVMLASALALTSLTTQASNCKGLSDSQCSEDAQCRWIKGYTRKDGRQVNGYCRTQSAKSKMLKADKQPEGEAQAAKPKS